jgi:hypothetical protein
VPASIDALAVKVHCVYADRFGAAEGLSGATMSDDGIVRITADNYHLPARLVSSSVSSKRQKRCGFLLQVPKNVPLPLLPISSVEIC